MHEKSLGDLDRTRTASQRAAYQETIGKGICPFCGPTEELPRQIRPKMIQVGKYWRAWHNPDPYTGHASHIILATIEHLEQPSELSPEARLEWMDLNMMLIEKLKLPGGGLVMRFGDHEYKGGSITHLHSHIQVPDRTSYAIAVFYLNMELKRFLADPQNL